MAIFYCSASQRKKKTEKMIKRVNAPLLLDLFLGLVLMNRVVTDGNMSLFVHL